MKEEIFKVGDKVFDAVYGWGEVNKIIPGDIFPISVMYKGGGYIAYTNDGKYDMHHKAPRLSFTEYDYVRGGFSQKRPFNPEDCVGKMCLVWYGCKKNARIDKVNSIDRTKGYMYDTSSSLHKCAEPLPEPLQTELLKYYNQKTQANEEDSI